MLAFGVSATASIEYLFPTSCPWITEFDEAASSERADEFLGVDQPERIERGSRGRAFLHHLDAEGSNSGGSLLRPLLATSAWRCFRIPVRGTARAPTLRMKCPPLVRAA